VAKADKYLFGNVGIAIFPDDAYMIFADARVNGSDIMLVENFQ